MQPKVQSSISLGVKPSTTFALVTNSNDLSRLDEAARGKVLVADLKALGIHDIGKQNWSDRGGEPGLELFYKAKPMTLRDGRTKALLRLWM